MTDRHPLRDLIKPDQLAEEFPGLAVETLLAVTRELQLRQVRLIERQGSERFLSAIETDPLSNARIAEQLGHGRAEPGRWKAAVQNGDPLEGVFSNGMTYFELRRVCEPPVAPRTRHFARMADLLRTLLGYAEFNWDQPPPPQPITEIEWLFAVVALEADARFTRHAHLPDRQGDDTGWRVERVFPTFVPQEFPFLFDATRRIPIGRERMVAVFRLLRFPWTVLIWMLHAMPWAETPPATPRT